MNTQRPSLIIMGKPLPVMETRTRMQDREGVQVHELSVTTPGTVFTVHFWRPGHDAKRNAEDVAEILLRPVRVRYREGTEERGDGITQTPLDALTILAHEAILAREARALPAPPVNRNGKKGGRPGACSADRKRRVIAFIRKMTAAGAKQEDAAAEAVKHYRLDVATSTAKGWFTAENRRRSCRPPR